MAAKNGNSAVDMPEPQVGEQRVSGVSGVPVFGACAVGALAGLLGAVFGLVSMTSDFSTGAAAIVVIGVLVLAASVGFGWGLTPVAPNEARVLQFLGRYTGTIRQPGLRWVNPLTTRMKVSTRIRNHETSVMKVNDADGNPIEIAAVVVWQVRDTAQAVFEVDDFVEFVSIQTETAVRHIATSYPYDAYTEEKKSLRGNAEEITEKLSVEVSERVAAAGVKIVESRITHLAYAPEIAAAMLQRQQAGALVAAKQRIVEGAVGMVELALHQLAEQDVVDLDEERKASMVSNLLVVLCGDRGTQPVVNTGSLYQ